MAVISIRLNEEEEKMIKYLSEHFNQDRSALIKHSLYDIYEDLCDREIIDRFEKSKKKEKLLTSDEIKKEIR